MLIHKSNSRSLRPLCLQTIGNSIAKFALCFAIFSAASVLGGCGQKGDLRPATPKPPVLFSAAAITTPNEQSLI
jgi:Prokaryotic lipoprotein-attachment site